MLEAAKKIYNIVKPHILSAIKIYKEYEIVITGHSLGGGTAIILSLLFKQVYPEFILSCFAYAPPPVVDISIINNIDINHSFILGDDVICRLSLGSIRDLLSLIKLTLSNTKRKYARYIYSCYLFIFVN